MDNLSKTITTPPSSAQGGSVDITQFYSKEQDPSEITVNVMPSVWYQDNKQSFHLSEVIAEITTSKILKEKVSKVRDASTDKERKSLKKYLPVFHPFIYEDKPTGIIQFDYDEHNIEKSAHLKNLLIEKFPSLLYAFISPSGGLKFGILTDYFSYDPDNFSTAYYYTKEVVLHDAGIEDVGFDDRMKTISYLCYMSYDPDAYFNPSAERKYISKDVRKRVFQEFQEKKDSPAKNKTSPPANITTTDKDKIVLLEAIDAIAGNLIVDHLHSSDRKKLARAIVNEFGHSDGADLVLNTLRFFGGQSDYLNSILKSDKNATGGTILYYARKCGYKGITETFKNNNTAGDTERVVSIPKDISRPKRYSIKEATGIIEKRIDQFLQDRINIQLIVEMGIGKTVITLKKLIECMDDREEAGLEPLRIAIFVPSHKLGNQSLTKLFSFEEDQIGGGGGYLGPKRYHKVIGGYGVHCEKLKGIPEDEKKGLVRNAYECDTCGHKETNCWYVWQFGNTDDLIRIYPHNYLYTPSDYDRAYKPDLVVIDEDFSSHAIIDREYGENGSNIWKRIIAEGLDTLEPSDITQAKSSLKMKIKAVKMQLMNEKNGSLVQVLTALYTELEDLNILLSAEGVVSVYKGKVHVCHKNSIHKKWMNVPMLYLNGTGNKDVSDAIFGKDKFKRTEEIRVEYNPNVRVYQLQNKSFNREQVVDKEQELLDLVSYFYHYDNSCFVSYGDFVEKCLECNPDYDPDRFMYFGNTRGKEEFEDKNIIIVIGRHYLPHQALATKGRVLFGCRDADIDDGKEVCTRTIEMTDTDFDAEIGCRDFTDERMRLLSRYYNEGEVLQAIHRLRLLHGTENKTVIYLSNHVLDGLRVDKFLIADDVLLNENRKKLVKAVQEHGVLEGPPRQIAKASGLTSKQVSNLKNKNWYKDNLFFRVEDDGERLIDRY
jgi:hypothetical protein